MRGFVTLVLLGLSVQVLAQVETREESELAAALPASCEHVTEDGKVFLLGEERDGTEAPRLEALRLTDLDEVVLQTKGGELPVPLQVLERSGPGLVGRLCTLVAAAAAGKAELAQLHIDDDPLIGLHLASPETMVLPEGVLERQETSEESTALERLHRLEAAVVALTIELDTNRELSALARRSIARVLELLPELQADDRYLSPAYARRLVAGGWLRDNLGTSDAVRELEAANRACLEGRTAQAFASDGMRVTWQVDDFDEECLTLTTPRRAGYARQLPEPAFYPDPPALTLVVETPTGDADSMSAAEATSAGVFSPAGSRIVSWTAAGAWEADLAVWREVYAPIEGRVEGYIPPHLLLLEPDGEPARLITAHGSLSPVADASIEEAERFITEAALALPDAAHLDLVGEILFLYVLDSPDPEHPMLIGNEEALGEIHQTAEQTLATTVGGICRGDCDDLAELYHTIARRQGHLCHIMAIPAHNALCWATEGEDGQWRIPVLQTGPPLEFRAPSLPAALQLAYDHFSGGRPFDPASVGLALRFSKENRRATWYLSYRIFNEPRYAETLIEVQRCWHMHTYQRGIIQVQSLIAEGDHDEANYGELGGLTRATGQWQLQAEYLREAIDRGGDPTLHGTVRMIGALFRAEDNDAAMAATRELRRRMHRQRERLGDRYYELALDLAGVLVIEGQESTLSTLILTEDVVDYIGFLTRQIAEWVEGPKFSLAAWEGDPSLMHLRGVIRDYTMVITECLAEEEIRAAIPKATLARLQRPINTWFGRLAFVHPSLPGDPLVQYGLLGHYVTRLLGEEEALAVIEEAAFPGREDLPKAKEGGHELPTDAPWIKASVTFWVMLLSHEFREEVTTLDRERVLELCDRIAKAHTATGELELESLIFDELHESSALVKALVGGDAKELRRLFETITRIDDKSLRDAAVDWIGTSARFLDEEWFGQVLEMWKEEVGTMPSYFGIAWSAALHQTPARALQAAKLAVSTFPDEPAFAEELEFMKTLLDAQETGEE